MSDAKAKARDAFLDELKRQAEEYGSMLDWLNPERGMSGVRVDGTCDFNAAIDAYEAKLAESGWKLVSREIDDAMFNAADDLMPHDYDDLARGMARHGDDVFYEVVPGPHKIWEVMWDAAPK